MEGKAPGHGRSRTDTRTKQADGGRWWPLRDRAGCGLGGWVRLWGVEAAEGQSEVLIQVFRGKKVGANFVLWQQSGEPSWGQGWQEKPSTLWMAETLTGQHLGAFHFCQNLF